MVSSSPTTDPSHPCHGPSGQKVAETDGTGHFASFISNRDPSRKLRAAILTCFFQFHFSLIMYLILYPIKMTSQNALQFWLLEKKTSDATQYRKKNLTAASQQPKTGQVKDISQGHTGQPDCQHEPSLWPEAKELEMDMYFSFRETNVYSIFPFKLSHCHENIWWGQTISVAQRKKPLTNLVGLMPICLHSIPRSELAGTGGNFQCMILLWGHPRLFCDITRGTPAWNDPEFDKREMALVNLCPNCTHTLPKL